MTEVGSAALAIIPSFQGFQGKLEQGLTGPLGAAGLSGGRKYGDAAGRSMATAFTSHAKKAALVAGAGLAIAGAAVIKLGRDSLTEAREAQKVGALTTQVIKSTGGAAKVTAKEVGDLAGAISLKTGIDDEAIQSGANLLLTFTNVRNEVGKGNDIFDQATKTMTDMSAALGTDASGSAIQLGKALNDPIKGVTALARVGVSFTEDQKAQIKTLVESGDTLKAQKVILGELSKEFGGAAAASATMDDKVSVATGNIKEKIGTALLPMVDDLERAFLKKGVPAIEGMVDSFEKKGIPAIRDFVDGAKPLAHELLPAVSDALGTTRDALKAAAPYAKDLVGAFNNMPDWAKKGLVLGGGTAFAASKLGLIGNKSRPGLLGSIASKASPLPVFVVNNGVDMPVPDGKTPRGPASKASKLRSAGRYLLPLLAADVAYEGVLGDGYGMYPKAPKPTAQPVAPFGAGLRPDPQADEKAAAAYRAEIAKTAAAFKTLPEDLQFDMVIHGGPEARAEAKALAKQFDLTAQDRSTLFKLAGIPEAKRDTTNLLRQLGFLSKPVSTKVTADTGQAMSALWGIQNFQLRDKYITVHARNTGGAGFVAAGGGTVPGQRSPYGDKIHAFLAPGEEVISNRFGQADRNRALLKAINANRMSNGGTAGGGGPARGGGGQIVLKGAQITAVFPGVGEVIGEVVDARIGDYRAHDAARAGTVYGGVGSD